MVICCSKKRNNNCNDFSYQVLQVDLPKKKLLNTLLTKKVEKELNGILESSKLSAISSSTVTVYEKASILRNKKLNNIINASKYDNVSQWISDVEASRGDVIFLEHCRTLWNHVNEYRSRNGSLNNNINDNNGNNIDMDGDEMDLKMEGCEEDTDDDYFMELDEETGPYADIVGNENYKDLRDWFKITNDNISRLINVVTTTKQDRNLIIKTGQRYNTIANRQQIRNEFNWDTNQNSFGVKIRGPSEASIHNACISTIYSESWNDITSPANNAKIDNEYTNIAEILERYNVDSPKTDCSYIFCYNLDFENFNLLSVSSARKANIFFKIRLKKKGLTPTPKGQPEPKRVSRKHVSYEWDWKIVSDRIAFNGLRNYQKLMLFIVAINVWKKCTELSQWKFDYHSWQGYYEPFMRRIDTKSDIDYLYIREDGETTQKISDTTATKYELYILVDKLSIERRLKKNIIDKRQWDLNDTIKFPEENIAVEDGEDDIFIQVPLEAYIWIYSFHVEVEIDGKYEEIICENRLRAYSKMIRTKTAGITQHSDSMNRNKSFGGWNYLWGTRQNEKADLIKGLRKQYNYQPHLYHTIEHENLSKLGEESDFDMNATNIYYGPTTSSLENHTEDYKFCRIIWSKITGESGQLTIGGIRRGVTNFFVAIPTPNLSFIGYVAQGITMTIAGHGVKPVHLYWSEYNWRICDIFRFIHPNLLKLGEEHLKKKGGCKPNTDNKLVCDCIQGWTEYKELPDIDAYEM